MASQITTDDRLDGWDAISDYLGWHVRTVIRWEKQKGLPVHRVPGGKRQPVYAYRHEIDLWFRETAGAEPKTTSEIIEFDREVTGSPPAALPARRISRLAIYGIVTLTILLIASLGIAWRLRVQPAIQITGITQLTDDGTAKRKLVTDGKQLYFSEEVGGKDILTTLAVSGGPIRRMPLPLLNPYPEDIGKDGKFLLVLADEAPEDEHPLWVVPTSGESPYQVAGIKCRVAAWSPNGQWIVYGSGRAVYIVSPDGTHSRQLSGLNGIPQTLQWSADGNHLLVFLQNLPIGTTSLWQLDLDRNFRVQGVAPVHTVGEKCCRMELLTREANAFIAVTNDSKSDHLIYLRPASWLRSNLFGASELNTSLGAIDGLASDSDAQKLFVISGVRQLGELVRYDPEAESFTMMLSGTSATYVDLTKKKDWAAYVRPPGSLWVSRLDGSDARQLSPQGMEVQLPRWSPDGKWIAFMGKQPDQPYRIFVIPAIGGVPKEASQGDDNQGAPTWSPDGKFLAYGNVLCLEEHNCAIHTINLASGNITALPDSQGLATARWSPDGRHIAALNTARRELDIFDLDHQHWRKLAAGINGNDVAWSSDSRYVYTKSSLNGPTEILRVTVGGGAVQTILNLDSFSKSPGQLDTWFSLTPDNALILNRWLNTSEIYELNYKRR